LIKSILWNIRFSEGVIVFDLQLQYIGAAHGNGTGHTR
jgi:hypothetical protein